MQYTGIIRKMKVSTNEQHQALYRLPVGEALVDMQNLLNQPVKVEFSGNIYCVNCQRKTKKSFNQGYCYPCMMSLAQCDTCIIKPELCHYHEGTCREPQWGEENCFSDHFVYLANTGNLKVGITRHVTDGISSRWIDQGASQAAVMLRVPDRLTSGKVEKICTQFIGDKTNWRTMLKGAPEMQDLIALKHEMLEKIAPELASITNEKGIQAVTTVEDVSHEIHYPVDIYPVKIKSINLDKTPEFEGTLQGIKGQYWMLDGDRVINMRKYAGYEITLTV